MRQGGRARLCSQEAEREKEGNERGNEIPSINEGVIEKEREEPVMEIARDPSPAALVIEKAKERFPSFSPSFSRSTLYFLFLSSVAGLISVPLSLAAAG